MVRGCSSESTLSIILFGSVTDGPSRFLNRFCLTKLPSRPLIIISPIPLAVLPTAHLQDRMLCLLNAFLSHPSVQSTSSAPFSLIMGPTRAVEAFLLHYDGIDVDRYVNPGLERYHLVQQQRQGGGPPASYYTKGHRASVSSNTSGTAGSAMDYSSTTWSPHQEQPQHSNRRERSDSAQGASPLLGHGTASTSSSPQTNMKLPNFSSATSAPSGNSLPPYPPSAGGVHHASTANGRTVKALLHTRIDRPPPSVSLSDGFEVRLANENDDLAVSPACSHLQI